LAAEGKIRIIGGQWRGRKLTVKLAPELRPTPNRLRETLFNWLQPVINGAHCLDMFAGTGALGFEAVSRGAASAVLLENDKKIFQQLELQRNAFAADNITIIKAEALSWITQTQEVFDIVFLDPPFKQGLVKQSCDKLIAYNALTQRGLVYVESEPGLEMPEFWTIRKQSRAGHVQCSLIEYSLEC